MKKYFYHNIVIKKYFKANYKSNSINLVNLNNPNPKYLDPISLIQLNVT